MIVSALYVNFHVCMKLFYYFTIGVYPSGNVDDRRLNSIESIIHFALKPHKFLLIITLKLLAAGQYNLKKYTVPSRL